jgi:small subunit ribosomal protein S16
MLKIRLARRGAKNRPFFHIVVAKDTKARDGRFIEKLGAYDPILPKDYKGKITLVEDRAKYWLSVGAQPTDKVKKFLSEFGLVEKPGVPEQTKKDKPKAKTLERMKEKEEKKKAAEEAKKQAEEEAKASEQQAEKQDAEAATNNESASESEAKPETQTEKSEEAVEEEKKEG